MAPARKRRSADEPPLVVTERATRGGPPREDGDPEFVGDPIPADEARAKFPHRYHRQRRDFCIRVRLGRNGEEEEEVKARCHYRAAKVEGIVYNLRDDVYVVAAMAEEGKPHFIGRITELFEGTDHVNHDPKRVFLSDERNDNPLDCIVSKVKILQVDPKLDLEAKAQLAADSDLYCDMSYTVPYSTFENITNVQYYKFITEGISSDADSEVDTSVATATLLDLYSGCGGMSTGLCLGAALAGLKLETRWAVDFNSYACNSLKSNHPKTEVRNEKADDFLSLLKEWAVLCDQYVHGNNAEAPPPMDDEEEEGELEKDEYVVQKLTDICYGGIDRKSCIYFKVLHCPSSSFLVLILLLLRLLSRKINVQFTDSFLMFSDCPLKIKEFVQEGHMRKVLPLPGDVDVLCGGPPCQGISGLNRFRNHDDPLNDDKNRQLVTFMNIVSYLRPKFVLMENVVDILQFAEGYLGSFCYKFISEMIDQLYLDMQVLPKHPLPTHNVVIRGGAPNAFTQSIVAYDEIQNPTLKNALVLEDAISDLPKACIYLTFVGNDQADDVLEYLAKPKTEFQRYIRLSRKEMLDYSFGDKTGPGEGKLMDHCPLKLNKDDYERVKRIPFEKGANFRDLEGVRVGPNNVAEFDPEIPRVYLESGNPLVPEYAIKFRSGKSLRYTLRCIYRPFGRLWWDETVPTVVTSANPHSQKILHPGQARVLTVRENARLQGFPDYYRLDGSIKERQVYELLC
ncbi:DNA (cytosine-5)-methyltransferase 1 [Triticum urartu]|uniref:DNA (cytosine-5-)-methyltransferase n=1 Tax=Triticum urartu TaxID=4572 RepID=M7YCV9_TRIUA|nr:DNA (cytosine-5)-methyltransferase 1 [Triticum urartu]